MTKKCCEKVYKPLLLTKSFCFATCGKSPELAGEKKVALCATLEAVGVLKLLLNNIQVIYKFVKKQIFGISGFQRENLIVIKRQPQKILKKIYTY